MNAPIIPHWDDITQPYQKAVWFQGDSYLNYPNLFNGGYQKFLNTIAVHNKRWPLDPWPTLSIHEFIQKAKKVAENKRSKFTTIKPAPLTREQAKKKLDQQFFNYVINKYGAWPRATNPLYQSIAHAQGFTEYPDLRAEKEWWLTNKMINISKNIKSAI